MMARLHNLSIRVPQRSDLKAVVELITMSDAAESMRQEDLEEEIRSVWQSGTFSLQSDAWIIINQSAQVVGYADVRQESERRLRASIYVHPLYRSRGVGTLLLWLVEEHAREHTPLVRREQRTILSFPVNRADQGARDFLEREGYLPARTFWRLVLDVEKILPGSNSQQRKLKIDMVLDEDDAADTMQQNGVSLVQHYTVYQKELRPGIHAAMPDRSSHEDMLIPRSIRMSNHTEAALIS